MTGRARVTAPATTSAHPTSILDEGVAGVLRILWNVMRDGAARRRVLQMRSTFRKYDNQLVAVALVARRPQEEQE